MKQQMHKAIIAVLFITAEDRKQPKCSSLGSSWTNTVAYAEPVKKNEESLYTWYELSFRT